MRWRNKWIVVNKIHKVNYFYKINCKSTRNLIFLHSDLTENKSYIVTFAYLPQKWFIKQLIRTDCENSYLIM